MSDLLRILCLNTSTKRIKLALVSLASNSIEYVPAGIHTIFATVNGEPSEVTILADEEAALRLDQDLQKLLKASEEGSHSRPFIDFDHEGKAAAAIPVRFYWEDGIRLEIEWTGSGSEAVKAKTYSYFSPEMLFDKKSGEIVGLPEVGPIGGLVNTPAFQTIKKLAAASSKTNPKHKLNTMDEIQELKAKLKKAEGRLDSSEEEIKQLKAALELAIEEKKAATEEASTLKAENGELSEKVEEIRKEKISAKIAAKGIKEENREAVLNACLKSEDDGEALLASYATPAPSGHPPVKKQEEGGKKKDDPKGIDRLEAAISKQLTEKGLVKAV